jgi:predicted DNA-binding protein (MmcQ/YjbR family)
VTKQRLREVCLALPGATLDYPFDSETGCFRVGGRIFALSNLDALPLKVNLKGDPALNRDLRASYTDIVPGWHMNKEHWNTVNLEGSLEEAFVVGLVRHSYDLVKASLPRSVRTNLG